MRHTQSIFTLTALATALLPLCVHATELPPVVQTIAEQAGITVGTDGGLQLGSQQFVFLPPPNYKPATPPTGAPAMQADGSLVWGNLQFVPVVKKPGQYPQFPSNLQVLPGNSLPPDFKPPAGMVVPPALPIPTGVTVPPLTNQVLVQGMVDAGLLPANLVEFNSDGSMKVNGAGSFLPFLPETQQQGRIADPSKPAVSIDASGAIRFPDGSTFAPVVTGKNAGGVTLPANFTPPAGTSLPSNVSLPLQFEIPSNVKLPPNITLPAGVVIPENCTIPTGTKLPPGVQVPSSVQLPTGVTVPSGVTLPAGT
ncbi:MAG: hypothetical protein RIR79_1052, partial [Pseudomonadota bacterium]